MSSTSIGSGAAPPTPQVANANPRGTPRVAGSDSADSQPARGVSAEVKSSPAKPAAPRAEEVKKAMERITDFVKYTASDIQFSVDKETDALVVKVIDRDSKEVLRQIPSEEVLQIARTLDSLQGLFVSQKV